MTAPVLEPIVIHVGLSLEAKVLGVTPPVLTRVTGVMRPTPPTASTALQLAEGDAYTGGNKKQDQQVGPV